jgi:hypothetical protein
MQMIAAYTQRTRQHLALQAAWMDILRVAIEKILSTRDHSFSCTLDQNWRSTARGRT